MASSLFQFLLVTTTLLTVGVLVWRVHQLERRVAARKVVIQAPPPAQTVTAVTAVTTVEANAANAAEPADAEFYDLFRSPLLVIRGQCEVARGLDESNPRLEIIDRQARRMEALLERKKPAGHRTTHEITDLDPGACVRAAADKHAELAQRRGVQVHVLVDPTPTLRANPFLLSHALRNLVRAAIAAAPVGSGDVTVACGELDGDIAFAVADDGPGLHPHDLALIFEPQAGEERASAGNAANAASGANAANAASEAEEAEEAEHGLAYSIVYAVSKALGAKFVLNSAPGAGTRATLRVPVRHIDEQPRKSPTTPGIEILQSAASR